MVLAVSFLLAVSISVASTETTVTADITTVPVTTTEPVFGIHVKHIRSSTSSVTLEWSVPYKFIDDVEDYQITARKTDSEAVLTSPVLPSNGTLYEVENLVVKSEYEICVIASVVGQDEQEKACSTYSTLAMLRPDSIIALIIAVGYILLMVVIGVICWLCAQRKIKSSEDEEEESEVEDEEELLKARNSNNLLAPPPVYRPRSSIEDELPNIPYITPPIEELNRDGVTNRKGYNSSTNV